MAHPKRTAWAKALAKQLGAPIYFDTNNTVWDTCKGAWQLHGNEPYHLVVQDDAILCKDFKAEVTKLLTKTERLGAAYQLYYGNQKDSVIPLVREEAGTKGYVLRNQCAWGVAIMLPTHLINDMIRFGNGYYAWQDDTKIKYFLKSRGIKTIFPIPCLVDHRKVAENPTLTRSKRREDEYAKLFKQ